MSRLAYVNGRFVPQRAAAIRVEDRGLQFADGVYEVWAVVDGRLRDEAGHFLRLKRSLRELSIAEPMPEPSLKVAIQETLRRNRVENGLVYLQITRGAASRDHAFPSPAVSPTLIITATRADCAAAARKRATGISIVTTPETRWARCDIKSVSLLPNVLAKQAAKARGALEAWFVDRDGYVTEGASSNAWIVTRDGVLATRELAANILPGITRAAILSIAEGLQLRIEERPFTLEEAFSAQEAFITSATNPATAVISIDGRAIGDGKPGRVSQRLADAYLAASPS